MDRLNRWIDAWEELFGTLARNPVRTGLTAAGVAWGMFMLVLMSGFGSGLETGVRRSLGRDAVNAVYFWGRTSALPWQGNRPGRSIRFENSDADAILSRVDGLAYLAPRNQLGGWQGQATVRAGDRVAALSVNGDVPDFARIQPMEMLQGRFLNERDQAGRRRVVVLGKVAAEDLFAPGAEVVGQRIAIDGSWFRVAGVFRSRLPGEDGEDAESGLHVPLSTFQQVFRQGERVAWFAARGEDRVSALTLEKQIRRVLQRRHGIHPDDGPAIGSRNAEIEFRRVQATFRGIRAFVLLVGTLTLLAGAFGVTNVMLVAVRERTRELGLRRAIGATQADIRWMILREALLLTVLAGEAGLLAGVGALELARLLVGDDHPTLGQPHVDASLIVAAGLLMALAGVIAGLVPAARAAAIQPVEALRSS